MSVATYSSNHTADCPICHAPAGSPCIGPDGQTWHDGVHLGRHLAEHGTGVLGAAARHPDDAATALNRHNRPGGAL